MDTYRYTYRLHNRNNRLHNKHYCFGGVGIAARRVPAGALVRLCLSPSSPGIPSAPGCLSGPWDHNLWCLCLTSVPWRHWCYGHGCFDHIPLWACLSLWVPERCIHLSPLSISWEDRPSTLGLSGTFLIMQLLPKNDSFPPSKSIFFPWFSKKLLKFIYKLLRGSYFCMFSYSPICLSVLVTIV